MMYHLTHEGQGVKLVIWAVRAFFPLGFTAVTVHGLIFKGIFFFSAMVVNLELTMKLIITTALQILKESVRTIRWVLCKKCRIETSYVKWFFLIHALVVVLRGKILFQAVTSCTLYLPKLLFIDSPQCLFLDTRASLLYALNSFSWVLGSSV